MMEQNPAATSTRPIVLVVDDDQAVRSSYKFTLELEGFEVRIYSSPGELLLQGHFPTGACLIVNYQMPDMNGLELVARLRDRGVNMPAILVTGHTNGNLRRRAAAAGVALLNKPFLGARLVESIRGVFG
jgi:FixJ family two-component response regulator